MRSGAHVGRESSIVLLRTLGASVAISLQVLASACGREPSALDLDANPSQPVVLPVAHGRVLEPHEPHPFVHSYRANEAVDPTTGHLFVLDPVAQLLRELSETGAILATRDVSEFRLVDPQWMTFAPSGDLTDDPSEHALYVAAGGRIVELSLDQPVALAAAATTATLVRTTLTSQYEPPSPDPSGIAYATHLGRLIIGDGEVNEMSIYAGANMFETTLSGSLSRTWNTLSFSGEPTGVAYNPTNRHLFISDDDDKQVYEVDAGQDGQYGTSDDRMTSFDTQVFGSTDPEGLAYDAAQRVLFIADGVNAQVYRVSPGSNGVFDGVAPAGDDQVTSFDTQVHGLTDPEGIAYDSDLGHLYVVGKPETLVFEFSPAGTLIGTVDISAANADKPAGLEYVPSVAGARTLYVVARGVDNDSDPRENDGKLYQFSLPPAPGNAQPVVTITAPPNGSTFPQGAVITFTGTASDAEDGNLTTGLRWTSSRDGTLGSGGSVSTSALSVGTHTITAAVTDAAGAQGSATISVTVTSPGSGTAIQVRVSASDDDAEESASGSVSLTSTDLELVLDGTDQQVVGMRFNAVALPPGAAITRAYLQFQVDEATSDATSLVITGHAVDNAAAFSTTSANISSRSRTASAVSWSPAPWPTLDEAGTNQQTPNLASIVQEIVNRPGWRSGNSLALIITGTGKRVAEAYDGVSTAAPLLRVEYSTGGTNTAPVATNVTISGTAQVGQLLTGSYTYSDADGDTEGSSTYRWLRDGVPIGGATARNYTLTIADQGTLIVFEVTPVAATGASPGAPAQSAAVGPVPPFGEARVAASSDDAEESPTGKMTLTSPDLEMVLHKSEIQNVGLRFNGVMIPPGATITRAYVQFQVRKTTSEATALTIAGEAVDNATTFSSTAKVSTRVRTATTVQWAPAPWTVAGQAGTAQQTPDLAAIIQEIISRPGWQSGNALAIIITGTGRRIAQTYDGLPAAAPLLRVEWSAGSATP